jgi:hypothetical protein
LIVNGFAVLYSRVNSDFMMLKRLTLLSSVLALSLVLSSCTKCGWIWNDWQTPASCRDDIPKQPTQ